ncbi:hypothetical protein [Delftia acidovorans]
MTSEASVVQPRADQYVLRFEKPGQRQRLKEQAKQHKRSLNNYLLLLIEAGEAVVEKQTQGAAA